MKNNKYVLIAGIVLVLASISCSGFFDVKTLHFTEYTETPPAKPTGTGPLVVKEVTPTQPPCGRTARAHECIEIEGLHLVNQPMTPISAGTRIEVFGKKEPTDTFMTLLIEFTIEESENYQSFFYNQNIVLHYDPSTGILSYEKLK